MREFVENSLDAAEAIGVLPEVSITMCARRVVCAGFAHAPLPCAAHFARAPRTTRPARRGAQDALPACADTRIRVRPCARRIPFRLLFFVFGGAARRFLRRALATWWALLRASAWTRRSTPTPRRTRRPPSARRRRRSGASRRQQRRVRICVRLSSGCVLFLTCSHLLRPQKRKADDDGGGAGGAGADDPPPAAAAAGPSTKAAPAKASAGPIYYRVTVRDNGKGMSHEDIPNMLGRVLSGTKYGVRQARGKFGLGAKMALIWAKQTTGQPILVRSALPKQSFVSAYTLDLDLRTNAPHVHAAAKEANEERWHGTQVSVLIRGAWSTYSARIVKYLRQLAVITPYAQISFRYASEAGGRSDVALRFRRRTTHMPPPPLETVHHPSAGALRDSGCPACVCFARVCCFARADVRAGSRLCVLCS